MTRFSSRLLFQFTPLREGRRYVGRVFQRIPISIHAPPRGATGYPARTAQAMIFQFTPLREGRRNLGFTGQNWFFISIHAPPRGATHADLIVCDDVVISIHAPPRGATASRNATMRRGTFQFTPLREGRRSGRRLSRRKTPISIHAPPRGATYLLGNGVELENISIHAPPRGATRKGMGKKKSI